MSRGPSQAMRTGPPNTRKKKRPRLGFPEKRAGRRSVARLLRAVAAKHPHPKRQSSMSNSTPTTSQLRGVCQIPGVTFIKICLTFIIIVYAPGGF